MSISPAEASALYLRSKYPPEGAVLKREDSKALEDQGWSPWLNTIFPDLFDCEFLPEHVQFWEWGWKFLIALRDREPLPKDANAFLDLLSRNYGKSLHCEVFMAAAVCVVGYGIFLYCHEEGTPIFDPSRPETGWEPVENHPTSQKIIRDGLKLRLWGLPKTVSEVVTPEHRYWARRIAVRYGTKKKGTQIQYGEPHWIEAQHLDWNTWIGHPIEQATCEGSPALATWNHQEWEYQDKEFPLFNDPDFWWMLGLWWGDGTLGGYRFAQISFSCADAHPDTRDKLVGLLSKWGYNPKIRPDPNGQKVSNVMFCDSVLGRWLLTWKKGKSRKEPPRWIESTSLEYQRELALGYIASDGHVDDRGVKVSSIYLPGLLSLRRMMARLGAVSTMASCRTPPEGTFPGGRVYKTARKYVLRIEHPDSLGIASTERSRRHEMITTFIQDGVIWSRVKTIEPVENRTFVPIQTKTSDYLTAFGRSHNCSGSQDLANEHLSNIEGLLTSDGITQYYPEHSRPKKSQITGANRGWTQKKIMTEGGATVWAIGLLVGVRGIRQGKERVRGFVLDDVDDYDDSPAIALKKANTLASSVLPTSDVSFFVIGAQNLITEHSVFHRIYTKQDMMLAHRIVCGPLKAFENLETEFRDGRDMIIGGESNWPERVTYDVGQRFIDTYGLIRFLAEFQHDFSSSKQGLCFDHYDDHAHVITRTEFHSMFGVREIPTRWYKYPVHDHARTKTVFHANVMVTIAASSMNERFPGFFFIDHPMSFPAQTEADEVALRFLKSVTPTVAINGQPRLWDELVASSLKRTNIDSYSHDVTKLLRLRRATLAKIIPPAVGPLLSQKNYKTFRMSHEQINAAGKVYKDVFGIPFQPANPGAEGGIELFNHFLTVDYGSMHPCTEPCEERIALTMKQKDCSLEEAVTHIRNGVGPGGRGFTRTLIIVEDGELEYTADTVSPERLHDAMLLRFQWQHWRYTTPVLNDKGEKEWGPQKMHDDFANCMMMAFHDNMPQAAPLNHGELVQEYMPIPLKDETIQAEVDPEKAAKLKMAQLMKMKGVEQQLQKRPSRNLIGAYRKFSRGK